MQSLADTITGKRPQSRSQAPRWRSNARHWPADAMLCPIDRNQKARLLHAAQALEARTRQPGRQNGAVSRIGMLVLRTLLLTFLGGKGACYPSFSAIMAATGLCRQSVNNALGRLERCGLIRILRRLETRRVRRECHITGRLQEFVTTVQTSNAYAFDRPVGGAELLAPPGTARAWPTPAMPGLLRLLDPSLRNSLKLHSDTYT